METETSNKVTISAEDFKLIKSFLPSFSRAAGIKTNDYVIDWNSIMPVVEKIESLDDEKSVSINGTLCLIKGDHTAVGGWDLITASCDGPTKIQAVYKAVVEFIKWYNNQKENGNRNS